MRNCNRHNLSNCVVVLGTTIAVAVLSTSSRHHGSTAPPSLVVGERHEDASWVSEAEEDDSLWNISDAPIHFDHETDYPRFFARTAASAAKSSSSNSKRRLRVIVMVGQSNMEGHGYSMASDPSTGAFRPGTLPFLLQTNATEFAKLWQDPSQPASSLWAWPSNVWIAFNRQDGASVRPQLRQFGTKLIPGYGGNPGPGDNRKTHDPFIGPELGFGWELQQDSSNTNDVYFLLKVAWGGKSLDVDFRPPSAGGATGRYYLSLMAHVQTALRRLHASLVTSSNQFHSIQLTAMAFHQGWNDGCDANMTAHYEANLKAFIQDVRQDWSIPNLPVVIAVSGMNGYTNNEHRKEIVRAQFAAQDTLPHVRVVETRDLARSVEQSPGNQVYHWNNNCESYWYIGKRMAQALNEMLSL